MDNDDPPPPDPFSTAISAMETVYDIEAHR
jgi:hypothetical protein